MKVVYDAIAIGVLAPREYEIPLSVGGRKLRPGEFFEVHTRCHCDKRLDLRLGQRPCECGRYNYSVHEGVDELTQEPTLYLTCKKADDTEP